MSKKNKSNPRSCRRSFDLTLYTICAYLFILRVTLISPISVHFPLESSWYPSPYTKRCDKIKLSHKTRIANFFLWQFVLYKKDIVKYGIPTYIYTYKYLTSSDMVLNCWYPISGSIGGIFYLMCPQFDCFCAPKILVSFRLRAPNGHLKFHCHHNILYY